MDIKVITLIGISIVWIIAESFLIIKDNINGKGKVGIDHRTRNYNTIATVLALIIVQGICWIPIFRYFDIELPIVFWTGIAISIFGLLLRHWSINILGKYFRTTVEIENGQRVIQKGPYKYIRHPSYSGIILFFIGYGLVAQNLLSLLFSVALPTIALIYRIKVEEVELVRGLGSEYEEYQKRTKKIIPGIW
jgi:protein-S-isoprenylcysteine O-methyltransferase Ste14